MVDRAIVDVVRRYLESLEAQGIPVSFGVLFGSQATGHTDTWSDVDLLVVSPFFDPPVGRDDISLLWRVAARTDSRIEPVPCGERQWLEDAASTIVEIARREGTRIELARGA